MTNTTKNIIANYIGRFWGFISAFIFIPIYIKILGIEAQGVISFMAIISTFINLADVGLTSTLSREIARTEDKSYISNLLYTIEKVYLGILIAASISIIALSSVIVTNFLKSDQIAGSDLKFYVMMMGIGSSLNLFANMYSGGLIGLQKQVLSNAITIIYNVFRSVIGIIIIVIIPSLYAYFAWYILTTIIYLFVAKYYLWKEFRSISNPVFHFQLLKNIWHFASGMLLMTFISVLNTQIDKLIVGKLMTLKDFAYYSLASFLAQIPMMLAMPIMIAVLPQLTKLASQNSAMELRKKYHNFSFINSIVTCISAAILMIFTKEIVFLWVGDEEIMNQINIVAKTLLVGGLFLGLQFMPFYLSLAHGHNKTNVQLGLIALIFTIPSIYYFISRMGLDGAGITWGIVNVFAFIYLGIRLNNKFLKSDTLRWFVYDVTIPLIIAFSITLLIKYLFINSTSIFMVIFKVGLSGLLSLVVGVQIYNKAFPQYKINLTDYFLIFRSK